MSENETFAPQDIEAKLNELVQAGYTQNGGSRYRLTQKALQILTDNSKRRHLAADISRATVNEDAGNFDIDGDYKETAEIGFTAIKPLQYPVKQAGNRKQLDIEQHEINKDIARNVPYRCLEILAELELANRVIRSERRTFGSEIQSRTKTEVGSDSYSRVLKKLEADEFVSMFDNNKSLRLTDNGEHLIALLKAYPAMYREETNKVLASTSLSIIETVLDELGIKLDPSNGLEDLPESTPWLKSDNGNIGTYLANVLNVSEDAVVRRLYDLRQTKRFLEAEYEDNPRDKSIGGIRILKKGLEFALIAQKELRAREQVIEEAAVEEAEELHKACLHLAESLQEMSLVEYLQEQFNSRSLFELTKKEFSVERRKLERLYKRLREDYIIEKSENRAA